MRSSSSKFIDGRRERAIPDYMLSSLRLKERLNIRLDPGIELLGVLDMLDAGRKPAFVLPGHPYGRAIAKAFSSFKAHPAVKLNAAIAESDLEGSRRKDALMRRGAPPALVFDEALSANRGDDERSGALEPWLAALRDFARDSKFLDGFAERERLLEAELAELRARVAKADYIGALERYTGETYEGRYTLIASPLCQDGGVLNRVWTRDDGAGEIISLVKLEESRAGGMTFVDSDLDACVWHELAHGVLDLTANLYDHEQRDTPLDLGPKLSRNCRNWLHGLREHLVRAVMLRLIALDSGEKAAAKIYSEEGFSARPHLKAFIEHLKEYERSRKEYPSLSDFYPRLVAVFPKPASSPAVAPGAAPYTTAGQRAAALRRLDRLLIRSKDARLIARRAALAKIKPAC